MQILWTQSARSDLDSHLAFLIDGRRPDAYRLCMTVDEEVRGLADRPYGGGIGRVTATREFPLPELAFTVVYTVKPGQIQVLRILQGL